MNRSFELHSRRWILLTIILLLIFPPVQPKAVSLEFINFENESAGTGIPLCSGSEGTICHRASSDSGLASWIGPGGLTYESVTTGQAQVKIWPTVEGNWLRFSANDDTLHTVRIRSTDGREFKLGNLIVRNVDSTTLSTITVTAKRNGIQVGSMVQRLASQENLIYPDYPHPNAQLTGEFSNIDTIEITGMSGDFAIDNIQIDSPTVPNQPPSGTISISESFTNPREVTLNLNANDPEGGALQVRFSNDNVNWTGWEPFSNTKPWTLTEGDGLKTVYMQLMDSAGAMSQPVFDGIHLVSMYIVTFHKNMEDGEANPITQIVINGGTINPLPTEPIRTGYTFKGWNTEVNGSGSPFTGNTIVTEGMTVFAQWEQLIPAKIPFITDVTTSEDRQANNIFISKNALDGVEVTHFKITDIHGGTLYKNDGVTTINDGEFITVQEGSNGLKFSPSQDANSPSGNLFTFKVQAALDSSGRGLSEPANAVITVTERNDSPIPVNDLLTDIEGSSSEVMISISSILANDQAGPNNENNQTLMVTQVERIAGGDVRIEGNDIIFTPDENFRGIASFRYTVEDNGTTDRQADSLTGQAIASMNILARANQPIVSNATTDEDTQTSSGLVITPTNAGGSTTTHYRIFNIIGGNLYKNDGTTQITEGTYITESEGGAGLKFTPSENEFGTSGFGFLVQAAPGINGSLLSDVASASIAVNEVNDNPLALDDTLTSIYKNSGEREIAPGDLLGNDLSGPANENHQILIVKSVDNPVGGTVRLEDSKVIFTPEPNFVGTASFEYTVEDNGTTNATPTPKTDRATVSFEITPLPIMGGTVGILGAAKFGGVLTASLDNLTYTPLSNNDVPTYQWFRNGTLITGAINSSYTLVEEDIGKVITVTVSADNIHATGSVTSEGTHAIQQGDSSVPLPVELDSKTTTSITLINLLGQEYSIDNGVTWQDSPTFTGLTPNTEYSFITRIKATQTMRESVNSNSRVIQTDRITYVVTYSGNNQSDGSAPIDSQFYHQDDNVTVKENTGNLVKTGYTFAGWNTKADGTGADYAPGTIFSIGSESPTLFAKWKVKEKTSDKGSSGSRPSPKPTTEEITVNVETGNVGSGSTVSKTPIIRTTELDGKVKDDVTLTAERAIESIKSIVESGQSTARIVIPDETDKVSEVFMKIPNEAKNEVEKANINLEVYTENARIIIPNESMENFQEDMYFHLIPIKEERERQEVEDRARVEQVVKEMAKDDRVSVIARPMTIETNMQSRPVTLVLPLRDVQLPTDEAARERFLNELVVFIEHSDGEKEIVKGKIVDYKTGQLGLEFGVNKFSTFTILHMEGEGEVVKEEKTHNPYIIGYGSEFRPNQPVTRAQMARMLARNLEVAPATQAFTDVPSSHWVHEEVMEVKAAGIMNGKTSTTFDVSGNVTRAQMAGIAYRWIQKECGKDGNAFDSCGKLPNIPKANFKDVDPNHWAAEAIDFMKATGTMSGYKDNTFRPNEKLTRAQAVQVLNDLFKRGPLKGVTTPKFVDVQPTHGAFEEIEEAARTHIVNFDVDGHEVLK